MHFKFKNTLITQILFHIFKYNNKTREETPIHSLMLPDIDKYMCFVWIRAFGCMHTSTFFHLHKQCSPTCKSRVQQRKKQKRYNTKIKK